MKKIIIGLIVGVCFCGCSKDLYVAPQKMDRQNSGVVFHNGRTIAYSLKDSSAIAFFGERTHKELFLHIFIRNDSYHNINFFPGKVTVKGFKNDDTAEKLYTYTPDHFLKRIDRQQRWTLALSALGKSAEDRHAGESSSTYSGTASTSDGTYIDYSGTSTTTDEDKKREAERENDAELAREAEQNKLYKESVKNGLLMKSTLLAGDSILGDVVIKYKSFDRYEVTIPIGDEEYHIQFRLVDHP